MVHRRQLNGQELTFGNQGALYGNAMTWWDHDTGSVWSQPLGRAIAGPRVGAELQVMSSTLTSWREWKTAHPGTLALDAPGGASGFDLDEMVIVVEFGDEAVAFPVEDLKRAGMAEATVADVPVAVVIDPGGEDTWSVFSRRSDEGELRLRIDRDVLVDQGSGRRFDPVRGVSLDGVGHGLDLLPGFTAFPRDFRTFWPAGRVWVPPGSSPPP